MSRLLFRSVLFFRRVPGMYALVMCGMFVWSVQAQGQLRGPDFLIIGAQKGGTTSLYRYLIKHPRIKWASRKEVHFFDRHYTKGMDWYRAQFPVKDNRSNFITGEATPAYIFHPLAAERISAEFPAVKLILVVRNPVDRAFSQYKMYVRKGLETRSFEQALAQERKMVEREKAKIVASGNKGYWSREHAYFSYASRGIYLDQIKHFMNYFDKKQLLVISSEDLMFKTEETVNVVLRFLELEEIALPQYSYYHVAHNNEVVLNPETRNKLAAFFEEKNKELQTYIAHELGQETILNWS
jgi:hypothetical protein